MTEEKKDTPEKKTDSEKKDDSSKDSTKKGKKYDGGAIPK